MVERPLIIVTGASRGIGRETANALVHEHGAHVLAISRDQSALDELRSAPDSTRVSTLALDLSQPDAPAQVQQVVGERRVHGVVHNAGLLLKKPLGAYTAEDLHRVFAVNVFAPLLLTQALMKQLAGDPPGHVLHIASMGGFQDSAKFPGLAAYSSSKAALACLAQCIAEEGKDRGVRSNCLAIGSVATEMLAAAFPGYTAPTTATEMGRFVARFVIEGHKLFNGKVLPVASTTP
ncbi:MAG: SDR family oxidoreductase [Flavobacteriales bacterium]|nr:SDR family oxidoreductase [Flavobacteriales bacterium]